MSNNAEKSLADFVIGCLPKSTSINRIESHATCVGFPDIEYHNRVARGTIELKVVPSLGSRLPLRDTQIGWMHRRLVSGDIPLIIIKDLETNNIIVLPFSASVPIDMGDGKSLRGILEYTPHCVLNSVYVSQKYIDENKLLTKTKIERMSKLLWTTIKGYQGVSKVKK